MREICTDTALLLEIENQSEIISPEEEKFLFEPFAKLTPQPTAAENSNGLGLAITKRLALLVGAEISFRRGDDNSSIFILSLPLTDTP